MAIHRLGVLLACVAFLQAGCNNEKSAAPSKPRPPAPVVLSEVTKTPFFEVRSFFGQVQAVSDAGLSAAESGRVTKVLVVEGESVKKGQVLVELDDQLARAQLSEAVASRKQSDSRTEYAKEEVERFELMRKEEIVSELDAMRKESEAQTLEAAAQESAARVATGAELLRRHRIVAPFDGIVAVRSVDPGDWLNSGQVALQLLTSGHVEVDVRVPSLILDSLDRLTNVTIKSGERETKARVASSVNALDPETRTALLRVTPEEETKWLRVGASVSVELSTERLDGLNIPRDAIVYGVAKPRVFLVKEGKAEPLEVEVVSTENERALVRAADLSLGDKIVIKGNERLRPGQPVTEEGALVPGTKKP